MTACDQKGWKTAGSGSTLLQSLPNPKSKFPEKFIFTQSIFVLLSTDKNAKTISLKVFETTDLQKVLWGLNALIFPWFK